MNNPNTSNSGLAEAVKVAQFRFALIAPVIQELYPDASRSQYYRRITEKPFTLPDGRIVEYKPKRALTIVRLIDCLLHCLNCFF